MTTKELCIQGGENKRPQPDDGSRWAQTEGDMIVRTTFLGNTSSSCWGTLKKKKVGKSPKTRNVWAKFSAIILHCWGSTVAQQLALLRNTEGPMGSLWKFACSPRISVGSLWVFPPGAQRMQIRWIGDSKLLIGVNLNVYGCLPQYVCPVMNSTRAPNSGQFMKVVKIFK